MLPRDQRTLLRCAALPRAQVILLGYALGVSPERLAQLYGLAKKRAAEARGDTT